MAGKLGDGRFILVDIKKEMHKVHNEMENDVRGPYKVKKRPYKVKNINSSTNKAPEKMYIWWVEKFLEEEKLSRGGTGSQATRTSQCLLVLAMPYGTISWLLFQV